MNFALYSENRPQYIVADTRVLQWIRKRRAHGAVVTRNGVIAKMGREAGDGFLGKPFQFKVEWRHRFDRDETVNCPVTKGYRTIVWTVDREW